jgi:hypothetical protein
MVITHNKRTIQSADIVYGVTMRDRGVTNIISLRLTESPVSGTVPYDRISSPQKNLRISTDNRPTEESAARALSP